MTISGICDNCKKFFEKEGRSHLGEHIFCNRKCYYEYRNSNLKPPNCECGVCKKKFRIKPSAIKNGEGKFCSNECKHKSQRFGAEISGESYNDRHLLRQSSQYRCWREAAKKRANYQCEECGKKDKSKCDCCGTKIYLHVHHVKSFAAFPEDRFDPSNSRVLCPKCHDKEEKNRI